MLRNNRNIPMVLFVIWWLFWLLIHNTSLSPIFHASFKTQFLFVFMIIMVCYGYIYSFKVGGTEKPPVYLKFSISFFGKLFSICCIAFILLILIYISYKAGTFVKTPLKYFWLVRGSESVGNTIVVFKQFSITMGLFIFPTMISFWMISLSLLRDKFTIFIRILSLLNLILFSYIYQVNYPILMVSFSYFIKIIVFERDNYGTLLKGVKKKVFYYFLFFGFLLFYAASNRYGVMNIGGILQRYLITYHTLGFYFFDAQLQDSQSLLNISPSYGRSFFGWFDSVFDIFIRFFNKDFYIAANLQNLNENMKMIRVGQINGEIFNANAFGTILYTCYRDFNIAGIGFYSFFYGLCLAISYSKSGMPIFKAVFLVLMLSGIISIYQSAVEKPFFWFSIFFILIFFKIFCQTK